MRPFVTGIAIAATAFVVVASATHAPRRSEPDAERPACIAVHTEARWVPYGYDHVVVLTNACSRDATCSVATNVNPTPIVVEVRAGATVEVVTFMGSPWSTFVAQVACTLRAADVQPTWRGS